MHRKINFRLNRAGCELCGVKFKSILTLVAHLRNNRHLNNLKKAKNLGIEVKDNTHVTLFLSS